MGVAGCRLSEPPNREEVSERAIGDSFVSVRAATSRGANSERSTTLFYSSLSLSLSLLSALRETFTATSISVRVKNRSSPASLRFAAPLYYTALAFMAGQDWPIKNPDGLGAAPLLLKFGDCSPQVYLRRVADPR